MSYLYSKYVPPEQIVDRDAPCGLCGVKWKAKANADVYASPATKLGTPVSSLKKIAVVRAGDWVTGKTSVVIARRVEGRVGKFTEYGVVKGPALKQGDTIAAYHPLGEGCSKGWIEGQVLVVCNLEYQKNAEYETWFQIELADASIAWTNSFDPFVTQEGMNDELGGVIADSKFTLPEKIANIDALVKSGAQLNGSAGKHGFDPVLAVVGTNSVELVRILISKGLDLRSDCRPAYWAAQGSSLRPGGDLMLSFLLANGMNVRCLREPPLHEFLRSGIATDRYNVEQAIKVAKILVSSGVNVSERDSQGRTIFDIVARAKSPNVAATLRQELLAMGR